ncbi:hypothetical protein BJ508DRAFT_310286 [Ascobolus immersus RN42]|uniref:Uncharacterized protein n=1 Tax=Ascobolus immersus RN42 TaxID=1160509 RepID=A0A3N4HTZ7_ASCIM|nr:hypothetical protein BJ508DRAFT_310286 [Ascobolus immersus RN42]
MREVEGQDGRPFVTYVPFEEGEKVGDHGGLDTRVGGSEELVYDLSVQAPVPDEFETIRVVLERATLRAGDNLTVGADREVGSVGIVRVNEAAWRGVDAVGAIVGAATSGVADAEEDDGGGVCEAGSGCDGGGSSSSLTRGAAAGEDCCSAAVRWSSACAAAC